jgi:hypothetical protein
MAQPCGAAEADAAAPGPLPDDLVALVLERLPPAEQCVTVSRLAPFWRRWAAPRAQPLAAILQPGMPSSRPFEGQGLPQLPLWCVAEAWPQLSATQRKEAGLRAAACGDVERLRWLRAQDPRCPLTQQTCSAAAGGGHLDVLKWLRAQEPPCDWDWRLFSMAAARGGHLDVLRWLRAQDPQCPWRENWRWCGHAAATFGHVDVLQWLHAQAPWRPLDASMCTLAAHHGHLDVLRWLRAQDRPAVPLGPLDVRRGSMGRPP